jgi:hypothetical protein
VISPAADRPSLGPPRHGHTMNRQALGIANGRTSASPDTPRQGVSRYIVTNPQILTIAPFWAAPQPAALRHVSYARGARRGCRPSAGGTSGAVRPSNRYEDTHGDRGVVRRGSAALCRGVGCAGRDVGVEGAAPASPSASAPGAHPRNLVRDGYAGRFRIAATVLQNQYHGPFPQPHRPDSSIPCPTPAGGWRPVDPARTTLQAFEAAHRMVNAQPDFAGARLGRLTPPDGTNDPDKVVLIVRFTGDLARHEAEIRAVYGGVICVIAGERSVADLTRIQQEEAGERAAVRERWIASSVDTVTGTVGIDVFVGPRHANASWTPNTARG